MLDYTAEKQGVVVYYAVGVVVRVCVNQGKCVVV
jgi:hypothetical protein